MSVKLYPSWWTSSKGWQIPPLPQGQGNTSMRSRKRTGGPHSWRTEMEKVSWFSTDGALDTARHRNTPAVETMASVKGSASWKRSGSPSTSETGRLYSRNCPSYAAVFNWVGIAGGLLFRLSLHDSLRSSKQIWQELRGFLCPCRKQEPSKRHTSSRSTHNDRDSLPLLQERHPEWNSVR